MIRRLIAACAGRPWTVLFAAALSALLGFWSLRAVTMDAIPDLSDVQVVIFTEWQGRSPDLVEDQITYPIVTSLLAAPQVQFVRGQSFFGLSFVYVIFEEGTDMYWARSRVLEYLSEATANLPEGVSPALGPDATGVGWVFQYALIDETGRSDLQQLRSYQDWYLRYALESVEGVAEVAAVGGYVKQYQVEVDPNALLAYGVPLKKVIEAIRRSNRDVGGRVLELAEREYMVRGRGYIKSIKDIEKVPVATRNGTPVLVRDVAKVGIGPDMRRGLLEFDGKGEAVGAIVVMRYGENALRVIDRVKAKLKEVEPSLPEGAKVVVAYDRSELIRESIRTLKRKLLEECLIVSLVVVVFLWHIRSALIPIITLPVAVLLAFIPMHAMGISSNIMSLGGIAIAVGAMIDAAIILVENAHKRLEAWERDGRPGERRDVLIEAAQEVGRPIFFALLVIAVSFIPIFSLEAQEGRLFKPLAFTKNYSMLFAAILAVTLAPALLVLLLRGGHVPKEEDLWINRLLLRAYGPAVDLVLRWPKTVLALALAAVLSTVPVFLRLGSEFMPPLWEGSLVYMPTATPGISIAAADRIIHAIDKVLMSFPEVEHVFGKVGRARSATDPAPLSMVEATIKLKPYDQWREGMTVETLKAALDRALQFPGMPNIWWMPIQTRIEMLATGMRSPIGIKVMGTDLPTIAKITEQVESVVKGVKGVRSVFAERVTGGYFLDFEIDRDEASRYGLTVGDVSDVIEAAIGGMNIDTTVEGRERYPINVRYPRDLRDDVSRLKRVLVATPTGAQVPIGQLARLKTTMGPPSIRDEDGSLAGFVFVDAAGRDLGGFVEEAQRLVAEKVKLPPGYRLEWAGQYRYLLRAKERLKVVVPLTLLLIVILLTMNTQSAVKTAMVLLAVPFSLVGAVWLLWLLGYNMSIAVWVGLLALAGVDAETGIVMLLYLDIAYEDARRRGKLATFEELKAAVHNGAVKRIRPKMMTVAALFLGLLPIMWSGQGEAGADVMKRIAAPMVGGILTSFVMELLIYPVLYAEWKWRWELKRGRAP